MIPFQGPRSARVALVVDDEPSLLRLTSHVLRLHGLKVLSANGVLAALAIMRRFRREIQILITEIEMAGMSGLRLSDELTEAKPPPAVLLISGVRTPADPEVASKLGPKTRFLRKPFDPKELVSTVNELWGQPVLPVPLSFPLTNNGDGARSRRPDLYQAVRELRQYAMFMADTSGTLTTWNAGVEQLLGYNEQEWIGRHSSVIFAPADSAMEACEAEMRHAGDAGEATADRWYRRKNGSEFFASSVSFPVRDRDGSISGYAKVIRDETDRKRSNDSLTAANEALERFASIASHDLQEPLRTMTAYGQLVTTRYAGKLDAEADQFLGFIVSAAKRLSDLVHDLLAYAQIPAKRNQPSPMPLDEGLETALGQLAESIHESGGLVTHDRLPVAMADRGQMVQLFQNLVGNAIKYRQLGRPAKVHISSECRDGQWIISVQDNGIGFDPQYASSIFVPFTRLNASNEYQGTGVGLAICRRIVEVHGGRIWAESSPGEGSRFRFTLPVYGEAPE